MKIEKYRVRFSYEWITGPKDGYVDVHAEDEESARRNARTQVIRSFKAQGLQHGFINITSVEHLQLQYA